MNYYELLEVAVTATQEEIRIAYRRKAKQFHPDLNKHVSADKMTELNKAYECLKDPSQKRIYDQTIVTKQRTARHGPYWDESADPFSGNPFSYEQGEDFTKYWEEMMRNMGNDPFRTRSNTTGTHRKKAQAEFQRKALSVVRIKRLLHQEIENKKVYTSYANTTCDLCTSPIAVGDAFYFMAEKQKMCKKCKIDILSHL